MTKNSSEMLMPRTARITFCRISSHMLTCFCVGRRRLHHKKQKNLIQVKGWEPGLGGVATHRAQTQPANPPHLMNTAGTPHKNLQNQN